MDLTSQYNVDEEYGDFPLWLNQARMFVDLRAREAQDFNHILDCHLPSSITRWGCEEEMGWTFEFDDLTLEVVHSVLDPVHVQASSWTMSRSYIDPLRRSLRHLLSSPLESRSDTRGFAMILLRLTEEAKAFLQEWKSAKSGTNRALDAGWDLAEIAAHNFRDFITNNSKGVDLNTIETSADDLLGTSIKKICEGFPETYRILHVELVTRVDLANRF